MKKVYLIYAKIPAVLFDSKIHDYVNDKSKYKFTDKSYIGLYAWTTNKELVDVFFEFRKGAKSIYNVITRELSKNEFKIFKKESYYEELSYYKFSTKLTSDDYYSNGWKPDKKDSQSDKEEFFSNDKDIIYLVCTKEEYIEAYEYGQQHIFDYMGQTLRADYIAFKDKYKLALDYIGYCDVFNIINDGITDYDNIDHFYNDRYEMTNYNNGYNLSYYCNRCINIFDNKLAIFINIFYEMIVGYDPDNEIKLLVYR